MTNSKGKGRIILIEGIEGTGKTTQVKRLAAELRKKGLSVLETKEPGSPNIPLTMSLRGFVLDSQYGDVMTRVGRELIMQAVRSITIQKEVMPATHTHDVILQDRGLLSSLAYGHSCGNDREELLFIVSMLVREAGYSEEVISAVRSGLKASIPMYDEVLFLTTPDIEASLSRALSAKQEFAGGDFIENKGASFQYEVVKAFSDFMPLFKKTQTVEAIIAGDKSEASIESAISQTSTKILKALGY